MAVGGLTLREERVEASGARRFVGDRWLGAGLVVASLGVLGAWALLAAVHVADRFRVDHVGGARMALAQYFNDGVLYPPLYDGAFYGGSRFMPLPIVLHGAAARLTGEYLTSGKILSYAVMAALLVLIFVLLRAVRCPPAIALGLTVLVAVTQTGVGAGMGLRADALPLLLQLGAVGLVAHRSSRGATLAASGLAALALVSKLSAVWAPLAIALWLVAVDRRRLPWFVGGYAAAAGALLGLFTAVSDGRLLVNVFGLSTAGIDTLAQIVSAPYRFVHLGTDQALAAWMLAPVVAVACWLAWRDRRASLYLLSLGWATAVVLVVLVDVGTGWNQLVDLVVLLALVVGELAGRTWPQPAVGAAVRATVAVAVLWALVTGAAVALGPDVARAGSAMRGADPYPAQPLGGHASADMTILSEDPYVPVSLGQRPVVLDAFMLPRIGQSDPAGVADLVERIDAQEFDLVVLVEPLEPVDREWWTVMNFGRPVVDALARSYEPAGRVDRYFLYEPAA